MEKLHLWDDPKGKRLRSDRSITVFGLFRSLQPNKAAYRHQSNPKALKAVGSVALAGVLAFGLYAFSEVRPSRYDVISGDAFVVDGDTLKLAGKQVRLQGIDAPELSQGCQLVGQARTWPAGRHARRHLIRLIASRPISCKLYGAGYYGRLIGVCRTGGTDLNAAMVKGGMAWAYRSYSQAYIAEERKARQRRLGIWQQTGCLPAWDYRRKYWAS